MRIPIVRSTMLRVLYLFCILSFLTVNPSAGHASLKDGQAPTPAEKSGKKEPKIKYKKGELLVRFKTNVAKEKKNAVHRKMKSAVLRSYRMIDMLDHVSMPEGANLYEVIEAYRSDPDVLYAQPNIVYHQALTIPNDSIFPDLWGLHNTGQGGGTPDADINAPEAWDVVTGSPDTVVAVLDTGVDYNHNDLSVNMWVNPGEVPGNGIDDDGNGYIDDIHGINVITGTGDPMDDDDHGTHVSGTIAASGNNGNGIAGVNWRAGIIACKFLDNTGYGTTDGAVECLDYLHTLKTRPDNPVNVIVSNNSWYGESFDLALHDAIDVHRQAGILFVAAAGNDSQNNDAGDAYPANFHLPNVISVAATDKYDSLASYSNFGRHAVHVAAPGSYIVSTKRGNIWGSMYGTSMAAPHVSGLAALLYSQDPGRDWITLKNLVIAGGQDKPATAGTTISGKRIRAFDANGVGSLSCAGQVVNSRLQPKLSSLLLDIGSAVDLSVLHINCAAPNGDVVVALGDGAQIPLSDDGLGFDAAAGDGIYSGQWLPPGEGTYTLTFPGNDIVAVEVRKQYVYRDPVELPYSYRSIAGTELWFSPPYEQAAVISAPFPISFPNGATSPYTELYVSPYGTISFTESSSSPDNMPLSTPTFQTLVAPFWTALDPETEGGVYWEVIGTSPNRELVVEWRTMPHSVCPGPGSATSQVVFSENRPEILSNYQNLPWDYPFCFNENPVTVGMQWPGGVQTYYSLLRPQLSLLWLRPITVTASAGPDQVVLPGTTVMLDGTRSFDRDGAIESYRWEQTTGTPVALAGADTASPQFAAPETSGTLAFELIVTNNRGQASSDNVDVVVNNAPVADAGPDRTVPANTVVMLNGLNSFDPDGAISHYYWSQVAGPAALLNDAYTPKPSFTAPVVSGLVTFRLTVTDNNGVSATDTVDVDVPANLPPIADAGQDQLVQAGAAVTLNGAGSSDPDGTVVSYTWTQIAGATVTLTGANTATPSFTAPPASGTLTFQLTVTDNNGATASDTVNVTVNLPPVADAGPDQLVQAGAAVILNGTGSSDPDGTVVSYTWSQIAGATVTLTGANTATPSFTAPPASGTLTFQLTITDNNGATASDTVDVNVTANLPPVADAGQDQLVKTRTAATLNGTASADPDGTIAGYAWSQIAGPLIALSDANSATPSFTSPATTGTLTFQLAVTDNRGAVAFDTVNIVVSKNGR